MSEKIKITAIIPAYNGEKYIAEAIQSINRQTLPVEEIIVVDDGSEDNTEKLVKNQQGNTGTESGTDSVCDGGCGHHSCFQSKRGKIRT